ncbi:MAG: ribonuclease HII [Candidatus Woesearchaeota archaeon]
MFRAGVDEAGRGPLVGPLVAALVVLDSQSEELLREAGVADSKVLTPARREALVPFITEHALIHTIVTADPQRIDAALDDPNSNLNLLEAELTAELLGSLPDGSGFVVIDLPTRSKDAYESSIRSFGRIHRDVSLVLEHKADANHVACAAASILAKVERDRLVRLLETEIGVPIGSGYPSDPKTKAFLLSHGLSHAHVFRRTWASYTNRYGSKGQRTLI